MLGFVVVDDGIGADVGNSFVFLVDRGILGVDVSKVGAVVGVDIAVPSIVVDGDVRGTGELVSGNKRNYFILRHIELPNMVR